MRAHRLILALSLYGAGAAGAASARPPSAQALPPFTVQDLVRLARVSEPAVSPDGKRVAYALRTTDMDANKGRSAIWLLDVRKRNAAADTPKARVRPVVANLGQWSCGAHCHLRSFAPGRG